MEGLVEAELVLAGDESSVTRFGEISPLGQTFKNLRQTFEGLFCVWQNFKPTNGKFYNFWTNFELL